MRNRLLPMAGVLAVVALMLLPSSPAAAACAPPYCPSYKLTVVKVGTGSGTVTSSPAGINCGPTCSRPFEGDTKVTLTAAKDSGSNFAGWTGCDSVTAERKCVVEMKKDTTVTATFNANPSPFPPPSPCSKVTLGSAKPRHRAVALKVTVPCRGRLVATGKRMRTRRLKARAAGTVRMKLRLTRAGLKLLKRRHKLKVKVTVTFTPRDNGTVIARRKTVTFRYRRR